MHCSVCVQIDDSLRTGRLVITARNGSHETLFEVEPGQTPERAIAEMMRAYLIGFDASGFDTLLVYGSEEPT